MLTKNLSLEILLSYQREDQFVKIEFNNDTSIFGTVSDYLDETDTSHSSPEVIIGYKDKLLSVDLWGDDITEVVYGDVSIWSKVEYMEIRKIQLLEHFNNFIKTLEYPQFCLDVAFDRIYKTYKYASRKFPENLSFSDLAEIFYLAHQINKIEKLG